MPLMYITIVNLTAEIVNETQGESQCQYTCTYDHSLRKHKRTLCNMGNVPGVAVRPEDGVGVIVPKVKAVLMSGKREVRKEQT